MIYDAVVVLSHLLNPDQTLATKTRERMDKGIEVMKQGKAKYLITTGGFAQPDNIVSHAVAMHSYAIDKGVPAERIAIEAFALDTVGQIVAQLSNFIKPNGWDKLLIVSSQYHMPRVEGISDILIGDTANIDYAGVPTQHPRLLRKEQNSLRAFRNDFEGIEAGNVEAIVERLFDNHALYRPRQDLKSLFYRQCPIPKTNNSNKYSK